MLPGVLEMSIAASLPKSAAWEGCLGFGLALQGSSAWALGLGCARAVLVLIPVATSSSPGSVNNGRNVYSLGNCICASEIFRPECDGASQS